MRSKNRPHIVRWVIDGPRGPKTYEMGFAHEEPARHVMSTAIAHGHRAEVTCA